MIQQNNLDRKTSHFSISQQPKVSIYHKVNRLKELGFTTNWNITDQKPDYDALQDPHASRYFAYKSVKIQLKTLQKSVAKSQKNQKQRKKLKRLIKQKIFQQLPAIKISAKSYNIQQQILKGGHNVLNNAKSKHLSKNKSHKNQKFDVQNKTMNLVNKKIHKQQQQFKVTDKPPKQNTKRTQSSQDKQRKQYIKKSNQKLHQKKHLQFLEFITKKKQEINTTLNGDTSNDNKIAKRSMKQEKINQTGEKCAEQKGEVKQLGNEQDLQVKSK